MRTAAEILTLLGETVRLLRARGWLLGFWFCLGWALHQAGLQLSARLGLHHPILANVCFALAVVIKLCSLVLMVHCLKPELRYADRLTAGTGALPGDLPSDLPNGLPVPAEVFSRERAIDVAALAVGPFLAVYAVWGFVDDEVRDLFLANYTTLGLDPDSWSINLSTARLPFYLGLAVAGWLLRQLIALLVRRRPSAGFAVAGVLAEGIWTLASFVALFIVVSVVGVWVRGRLITAEVVSVWRQFLGALPNWELIFGARLADLVQALVTVLPGAVATALLLPLMWVALTATVFGWRDFRASDVAAGTRFGGRIQSLSERPRGLLGAAALLATSDLRTKYLPVLQAFRLIVRAGPRFVGAYLLLATCLSSLDQLAQIGLNLLIGPQSQAVTLLIDPLQQLVVGLLITSASVALYAAGFDRALVDASRPGRAQRTSSITSRPSLTEIQSES